MGRLGDNVYFYKEAATSFQKAEYGGFKITSPGFGIIRQPQKIIRAGLI